MGRVGASINLGSLTHIGMVRRANQDAYCARLGPDAPVGADALLAVADGMGGHPAGDVASEMAIQGLAGLMFDREFTHGVNEAGAGWGVLLGEAITRVNIDVFQAAMKPEKRGMGTTLTGVVVAGATLTIGHVGDSRAYLLRDGYFHQVTTDHTWVAEQVARGILSPEVADVHPDRNVLTRAVGTTPQVEVEVLALELREGDTLLLCSDGLHSLVSDEDVAGVLMGLDPVAAAQALVDRANELGGNDNVTVIVTRMERLAK
jgi:serine/threonine protein phosphatase PrpC